MSATTTKPKLLAYRRKCGCGKLIFAPDTAATRAHAERQGWTQVDREAAIAAHVKEALQGYLPLQVTAELIATLTERYTREFLP